MQMKTDTVDVVMGLVLQAFRNPTQLPRQRGRGCSTRLYFGNELLDAASIGGGFWFRSYRCRAFYDSYAAASADLKPSFPSKLTICLRHGIEVNANIQRKPAHSG